MYKRILVPLDGSAIAEKAIAQATGLCADASEIVLLQVIRLPLPVMTPDIGMTMPAIHVDDMMDEATSYLSSLADDLNEQGINATIAVVEGDNVANTIVAYARENNVALIVKSTHGRGGFSRLVFGSVAEGVLRQTPCPVMFIRPEND